MRYSEEEMIDRLIEKWGDISEYLGESVSGAPHEALRAKFRAVLVANGVTRDRFPGEDYRLIVAQLEDAVSDFGHDAALTALDAVWVALFGEPLRDDQEARQSDQ